MNWLFRSMEGFTAEEYDAVYKTLTDSRKAHVDRLKQEDDKRRTVFATALVEEMLQRENQAGAGLETDVTGRPFLKGSDRFVSISHCEEGVACVLAETAVGIDLERIRPVKKALIDYVCLPCERAYVLADSQEEVVTDIETLTRFFEVWTAKEAYFKKHRPKDLLSVNTLTLTKECLVQDGFIITLM